MQNIDLFNSWVWRLEVQYHSADLGRPFLLLHDCWALHEEREQLCQLGSLLTEPPNIVLRAPLIHAHLTLITVWEPCLQMSWLWGLSLTNKKHSYPKNKKMYLHNRIFLVRTREKQSRVSLSDESMGKQNEVSAYNGAQLGREKITSLILAMVLVHLRNFEVQQKSLNIVRDYIIPLHVQWSENENLCREGGPEFSEFGSTSRNWLKIGMRDFSRILEPLQNQIVALASQLCKFIKKLKVYH